MTRMYSLYLRAIPLRVSHRAGSVPYFGNTGSHRCPRNVQMGLGGDANWWDCMRRRSSENPTGASGSSNGPRCCRGNSHRRTCCRLGTANLIQASNVDRSSQHRIATALCSVELQDPARAFRSCAASLPLIACQRRRMACVSAASDHQKECTSVACPDRRSSTLRS